MSDLNQSPKQDELSRGNEPLYHTSVPLAAVEAMVNLFRLDYGDFEDWIYEKADEYDRQAETYPEWLIAALNCEHYPNMSMPLALHTFLMNWRPE